jgi:hypothetical protein
MNSKRSLKNEFNTVDDGDVCFGNNVDGIMFIICQRLRKNMRGDV